METSNSSLIIIEKNDGREKKRQYTCIEFFLPHYIMLLVVESLTHSLDRLTGDGSFRASDVAITGQAASAASPTSTSNWRIQICRGRPLDLVDVSIPVCHPVGDQHGRWQSDEVLHVQVLSRFTLKRLNDIALLIRSSQSYAVSLAIMELQSQWYLPPDTSERTVP